VWSKGISLVRGDMVVYMRVIRSFVVCGKYGGPITECRIYIGDLFYEKAAEY